MRCFNYAVLSSFFLCLLISKLSYGSACESDSIEHDNIFYWDKKENQFVEITSGFINDYIDPENYLGASYQYLNFNWQDRSLNIKRTIYFDIGVDRQEMPEEGEENLSGYNPNLPLFTFRWTGSKTSQHKNLTEWMNSKSLEHTKTLNLHLNKSEKPDIYSEAKDRILKTFNLVPLKKANCLVQLQLIKMQGKHKVNRGHKVTSYSAIDDTGLIIHKKNYLHKLMIGENIPMDYEVEINCYPLNNPQSQLIYITQDWSTGCRDRGKNRDYIWFDNKTIVAARENYLGLKQLQKKNYSLAMKHFSRSLQLSSDLSITSELAHFNMACAMALAKMPFDQTAQEHLEKSVKASQRGPENMPLERIVKLKNDKDLNPWRKDPKFQLWLKSFLSKK